MVTSHETLYRHNPRARRGAACCRGCSSRWSRRLAGPSAGSSSMTGRPIAPARFSIAPRTYHPWIEPQHLPRGGARAPGGESVIMRFLPREAWEGYDAILRLDADLTFKPQFAELLLAELEKDPRLGIVGPTLYETQGARWHEIPAPSFHTRGAAKLVLQRMLRRDRRPRGRAWLGHDRRGAGDDARLRHPQLPPHPRRPSSSAGRRRWPVARA